MEDGIATDQADTDGRGRGQQIPFSVDVDRRGGPHGKTPRDDLPGHPGRGPGPVLFLFRTGAAGAPPQRVHGEDRPRTHPARRESGVTSRADRPWAGHRHRAALGELPCGGERGSQAESLHWHGRHGNREEMETGTWRSRRTIEPIRNRARHLAVTMDHRARRHHRECDCACPARRLGGSSINRRTGRNPCPAPVRSQVFRPQNVCLLRNARAVREAFPRKPRDSDPLSRPLDNSISAALSARARR